VTTRPASTRVAFETQTDLALAPIRRQEPVTIGIPFPPGIAPSAEVIHVEGPDRALVPAQVRTLDSWPDGSVRWALADFSADADFGRGRAYAVRLEHGDRVHAPSEIRVTHDGKNVLVDTGRAHFEFTIDGAFPFSRISVGSTDPLDMGRTGMRIEAGGQPLDFRIACVTVQDAGPLRAELEIVAASRNGHGPLQVVARVELFAATATARVDITIRNSQAAKHPGGQWVLGDPGSIDIRAAALVFAFVDKIDQLACAPEAGLPLTDIELPFEIYQESSGGERWNAAVHRNRNGVVPLRFRGYRLRSGHSERQGERAAPIIVARTRTAQFAATIPEFWENFPKAIAVDDTTVELGLFPRQFPEPHELQGGEQKTHRMVIAFDGDRVSDPPLAWCHEPLAMYPSPEWSCNTGAVPLLLPAADDPNDAYLDLIGQALDSQMGFASKRESADEFGWRNFGDLYADHESAFQPPDAPFVSHYNNQYDPIAAFAVHFLRTGDQRWWQLMTALARHVRDIDIYHTRDDKAAYNGGLFWHTAHYLDAGTSTHRTYPKGSHGGGPSNEHNYSMGLMWHYFLTGERASRESAIGLARWVIERDDGRLTQFRWLARGATGLASSTQSTDYHGPGRGAGNSILACLVAHRLTGEANFASKADELIARCIHPADDIDARDLLNPERRWSYTVFLQTLGFYLHGKHERNEIDRAYGYAQASLLHYASWMLTHERPYLSRPELLEYPNETWAAQDIRKADVFLWATRHCEEAERAAFLERAKYFFDYAITTLAAAPTRHYTRPVVLLLSNGFRYSWFLNNSSVFAPSPVVPFTEPAGPLRFEPQKSVAMRRAKWIAIACAIGAVLGVLLMM
jgi:hypothetical protein